MRFAQILDLQEGLYDPDIFKALIVSGTPGAGKSRVVNFLSQLSGLRPVNTDSFYEMLMSRQYPEQVHQLATDISDDPVWIRSTLARRQRLQLLLQGRIGLLLDTTAADVEQTSELIAQLRSLGYDVAMLVVTTDLSTAMARQSQRNRRLSAAYVTKAFAQVQQAVQKYQQMLPVVQVSNPQNITVQQMAERAEYFSEPDQSLFDWFRHWLSRPVNSPAASRWKAQQRTRPRWQSTEQPSFSLAESAPLKPGQLRPWHSTKLLKRFEHLSSQVQQFQELLDLEHTRLNQLKHRKAAADPDFDHIDQMLLDAGLMRIPELQKKLKPKQQALNSFLKKHPPELLQRRQQQMQALAARMRQQCSDHLVHMSPDQVLYRGLVSAPDQVFQGHSRLSRKPTDSNPGQSRLYNQAAVQLGFKAHRGNSIFCSGNIAQAQEYGDVFVIVPKNSADFTWSQTTSDLILRHGYLESRALIEPDPDLQNFVSAVEQEQQLLNPEPRLKTNKDLGKYWYFLNSIRMDAADAELTDFSKKRKQLVQLRSAAAQHLDLSTAPLSYWIKYSKLKFDPQLNLRRFQQHFALSSTDLGQAIKSGHEVLVRGEYFAIALDIWKSELAPLLFAKTK